MYLQIALVQVQPDPLPQGDRQLLINIHPLAQPKCQHQSPYHLQVLHGGDRGQSAQAFPRKYRKHIRGDRSDYIF